MNYFLELKIHGADGTVLVRPEAVLSIERADGVDFEVIRTAVSSYRIERGQFHVNKLINHTSHAGLKVLTR